MKVKISRAAQELGVHQETLRRWELAGKIQVERTPRGHWPKKLGGDYAGNLGLPKQQKAAMTTKSRDII